MNTINPATTRLLAIVLRALPIAQALTMPSAQLRREIANLQGTINVYARLDLLDVPGQVAVEPLLALSTQHKREAALAAIGAVAVELANRSVNSDDVAVIAAAGELVAA